MTDPRSTPTGPGTRNLRDLVDALLIVEQELRLRLDATTLVEQECRFQAKRLEGNTNEFLVRMAQRYDDAVGTLVTLRRYQEGRVREQEAKRSEFDNAITSNGIAVAHTEDEDDGN